MTTLNTYPETKILLASVNAKYIHASLGIRCVWSHLGKLRDDALIKEFDLHDLPDRIAETILAHNPRLVGVGLYIWNIHILTEVLHILKTVRPELVLVAGGPEASYEYESRAWFEAVDYVVRGEGEEVFAELAALIIAGTKPTQKVWSAGVVDLESVTLPYEAYTDEDISKKTLYVESSRGCPFRCAFCLSALDHRVRYYPVAPFLQSMQRIIARGGRRLKFVDRTFNLRWERYAQILEFFLEHWQPDLQIHLEIMPDRLTPEMMELLARFPPAGLHLEAGVQSFNPETLRVIARDQNLELTRANLCWLRQHTGALLHADLVLGLPEETWESLQTGFDTLCAINPHEIQVGILKRLRGAPIVELADTYQLGFSPTPPYEVLQTSTLDFMEIQRLKRFARYFQLYYNSGKFDRSIKSLLQSRASAFVAMMELSDWLWEAFHRTHELPPALLAKALYSFWVEQRGMSPKKIATALDQDLDIVPHEKRKLVFLRSVPRDD